jgi:hypothetical protein
MFIAISHHAGLFGDVLYSEWLFVVEGGTLQGRIDVMDDLILFAHQALHFLQLLVQALDSFHEVVLQFAL